MSRRGPRPADASGKRRHEPSARIAEIGETFADLAKKKPFEPSEAIGIARFEQVTGRIVRTPTHAGADFIDSFFGPVALKGPVMRNDGRRILTDVEVDDFLESVLEAASFNSAVNAVAADLMYFSPAQIERFQAGLRAGNPAKPIQMIF